jgi:hypothetical protein
MCWSRLWSGHKVRLYQSTPAKGPNSQTPCFSLDSASVLYNGGGGSKGSVFKIRVNYTTPHNAFVNEPRNRFQETDSKEDSIRLYGLAVESIPEPEFVNLLT